MLHHVLGFLYDSRGGHFPADREKQKCAGMGLGPRSVLLLSGEAPVPLLPILETIKFLDDVKKRGSKGRLDWAGVAEAG